MACQGRSTPLVIATVVDPYAIALATMLSESRIAGRIWLSSCTACEWIEKQKLLSQIAAALTIIKVTGF
jgi:hypothetical protein